MLEPTAESIIYALLLIRNVIHEKRRQTAWTKLDRTELNRKKKKKQINYQKRFTSRLE